MKGLGSKLHDQWLEVQENKKANPRLNQTIKNRKMNVRTCVSLVTCFRYDFAREFRVETTPRWDLDERWLNRKIFKHTLLSIWLKFKRNIGKSVISLSKL